MSLAQEENRGMKNIWSMWSEDHLCYSYRKRSACTNLIMLCQVNWATTLLLITWSSIKYSSSVILTFAADRLLSDTDNMSLALKYPYCDTTINQEWFVSSTLIAATDKPWRRQRQQGLFLRHRQCRSSEEEASSANKNKSELNLNILQQWHIVVNFDYLISIIFYLINEYSLLH